MSTEPSLTSTARPSNPTTPAFADDLEWIKAYLIIHKASMASHRYAYLLWFLVAIVFISFAIFHVSFSRSGFIGAHWKKWAMRKRTWRGARAMRLAWKTGKCAYPTSLQPNGQLLAMTVMFIGVLLLAFVGPDYISPATLVLDMSDMSHSAHNVDTHGLSVLQPQYTIGKAWWTSANRVGIIAFAVMPLCVLFVLKSPPFALLALPIAGRLHFDKLSWLHRWSGRLIWFLASLHVGFWSVQLIVDRRADTGGMAYSYAFQYSKFRYGWLAYVVLTLIVIGSINSIRKYHYEIFYALHFILVPSMLILSSLHHPPIWWWCWSAFALWAGERLWRLTWYVHINGVLNLRTPSALMERDAKPIVREDPESQSLYASSGTYTEVTSPQSAIDPTAYCPPPGYTHAELLPGATIRLTYVAPGPRPWAPGQHFLINIPSVSKVLTHPFTCASIFDEQASSDAGRALVFLIRAKGGWTKRLRNHVASLCSLGRTTADGEILPLGITMPDQGVLLKMNVDGPFGSPVRARWGSHSTVLIVVGGSGVSFGLSVLQYVCMCISGRNGARLGGQPGGWGWGGFSVQRVRFIWLIREFGHIQWCASAIRRCMAMVPSSALEINIFVTNIKPTLTSGPSTALQSSPLSYSPPTDAFVPITPTGVRKMRSRANSTSSDDSTESYLDTSPRTNVFGDEEALNLGYGRMESNLEDHTWDLTSFEGEYDVELPGEDIFNSRVERAGIARRATSKRLKKTSTITSKSGSSTARRFTSPEERISLDGLLASRLEWVYPPTSGTPAPRSPASPSYGRRASHDQSSLNSTPTPSPRRPRPPYGPRVLPPIKTSLSSEATEPLSFSQVLNIAQNTAAQEKTLASDAKLGAQLQVNEQELDDLSVVSEHARTGKPKLDRIIGYEVHIARGSTIVACCGPSSLNAMVRKSIAMHIDPARIRAGDLRGYIDLVSEEFEF
ncbi:hypothetical protein BD779DRAFT_1436785 [Infundibulicybe gibba]|nr:hypothetical protein BD779DRAFT_1436785 [Infundibulicybe gibba]